MGLSGTVRELPLSDLVEMIALGGKTGRLVIRDDRGDVLGEVVLNAGRLAHAISGGLAAEKAFARLMGVTSGSFDFTLTGPPEGKSLDIPAQSLLMDAMRRVDEIAELSLAVPPEARVRAVGGAAAGDALEGFLLAALSRGEGEVAELLAQCVREGTGDEHDALVALKTLLARHAIELVGVPGGGGSGGETPST